MTAELKIRQYQSSTMQEQPSGVLPTGTEAEVAWILISPCG